MKCGNNVEKNISYVNGNTKVTLNLVNGTRTLETDDDNFDFSVPINMDIKVSNRCQHGCAMCHENSVPNGDLADADTIKEVLSTWGIPAEVANGGGALTEHPQLEEILKVEKELGLIANGTFHYKEILQHHEMIKEFQSKKMLYGIGVSIPEALDSEDFKELSDALQGIDNVVFHVIAGIVSFSTLTLLKRYFNKPKLLILGYKNFRRGNQLYDRIGGLIEKKIDWLRENITSVMNSFYVVSFDDLALKQLDMKNQVSESIWESCYQGSDTSNGMYIDMVKKEFACNSTSEIRYPIVNDVKNMFSIVKNSERSIGYE